MSGNPCRGLRRTAVATALVGCVVLSGCARPDPATSPTESPSTTASSTGAASPAPDHSTASPSPAAGPTHQAPRGWKTYWDVDRTIRFDLPQRWIVQPASGPKDGVAVKVRNADGQVMAKLITGMADPKAGDDSAAACDGSVYPYVVLASEDMDLPVDQSSGAASKPRFVYRLIKGQFKFWASFGITDRPAGSGGVTCRVWNRVEGPKKVGTYRFSDVLNFTASGEDGLQGFGTIGEAQEHMKTKEYKTMKRMIKSLEFTN